MCTTTLQISAKKLPPIVPKSTILFLYQSKYVHNNNYAYKNCATKSTNLHKKTTNLYHKLCVCSKNYNSAFFTTDCLQKVGIVLAHAR